MVQPVAHLRLSWGRSCGRSPAAARLRHTEGERYATDVSPTGSYETLAHMPGLPAEAGRVIGFGLRSLGGAGAELFDGFVLDQDGEVVGDAGAGGQSLVGGLDSGLDVVAVEVGDFGGDVVGDDADEVFG